MQCIVCGSRDAKIIEVFPSGDFFKGFCYDFALDNGLFRSISESCEKQYKINHCNSCGLEFAEPMKGGDSIFYDIIYTYMAKTGLRWEFDIFKADFNPPAKILDIGCGDGSFVKFANKLGYQSKGIDFNPSRIDMAKDVDAEVENIDIKTIDHYLVSQKDTDIYTLWHVLEHLEDPLKTFSTLYSSAKKGSHIVLSIPSDRFYGTHRTPIQTLNYPPHHLTRWTAPALRILGEKSGWQLEDFKYEPLNRAVSTYGSRLIKSILHHHNLFEELYLFITKRKFSNKALSPVNDKYKNTLFVKIAGRIAAKLMLLEKNRLSNMSLYVKFKKG
ncbi:MAG: class I SAM-dependent methyltransferase [bacterium]